MIRTAAIRSAAAVVLLLLPLACGGKVTPEQRTEKLRLDHEITPVGSNVIHDAEGKPTTIVDLRVVNNGVDHLDHLTVLVAVHGADGAEKVSRRVTLDLSQARPGVGIQVAATLPGVDLAPDDQVTVELESNVPPDVLHTFPEYSEVAAAMQK